MAKYNPQEIETKWQAYWDAHETFKTGTDKSKPKYYCLDMFPYPSGAGLHVGHPEGYTATDIICRYKRSRGFNVLHPMGWDAFGLPAEQYAIQTGTHPAITTKKNCDNFRRQIKRLGLSYDWNKEVNTTDPKYYKWTQWIFKRLYGTWFDEAQQKGRPIEELPIPADVEAKGAAEVRKYKDSKRLAYYADAQVWWCKHCKIVCANEEVLNDGSHEKCGTKEVERRNLKQWLMRIPLYGDRLLKGLDKLDWPQGVKDMQKNWIGKSYGAEVDFAIADAEGKPTEKKLRVYTTRCDTLFGATYMVVAPEHAMVPELTTAEQKAAVEEYVHAAALKSDLDRTELAKEKTGVFTGSYAVNPLTGTKIPVWVADYVLTGYGTGAIMAVPAHDTRDFDFAKKFNLPVICIMEPDASCPEDVRPKVLAGEACWAADGTYINSENATLCLNGLNKKQGIAKVIEWLEANKIGKATVNYKLRDWLFSRQRYWGEPFPIIHWEDGEISTVDDLGDTLLLVEAVQAEGRIFAVDVGAVGSPAGFALEHERLHVFGAACIGFHDADDGQVKLLRKVEVTSIVSRHSHDSARAVAGQNVVGDPHRNLRAGERVHGVGTGEHASLFLGKFRTVEVALESGGVHVFFHGGLLFGSREFRHHGMFRSHHHVGRTEQRIATGRVDAEVLVGRLAFGIGDGEIHFGTEALANPVLLHVLHALGPVELVEALQQAVAIQRNAHEPLLQVTAFHFLGAALFVRTVVLTVSSLDLLRLKKLTAFVSQNEAVLGKGCKGTELAKDKMVP